MSPGTIDPANPPANPLDTSTLADAQELHARGWLRHGNVGYIHDFRSGSGQALLPECVARPARRTRPAARCAAGCLHDDRRAGPLCTPTPTSTTVRIVVTPQPIPPAQARVLVFKDTALINNAPDVGEAGLGGFRFSFTTRVADRCRPTCLAIRWARPMTRARVWMLTARRQYLRRGDGTDSLDDAGRGERPGP